jgi:hypothetical protein
MKYQGNKKDGDIVPQNKRVISLLDQMLEHYIRNPKYKQGVIDEQYVDDNVFSAPEDQTEVKHLTEIKTETLDRVLEYGNFYVETHARINGYQNFYPSGISTTKSKWWVVCIKDKKDMLLPYFFCISTDYIKELMSNSETNGIKLNQPTLNLDTGDDNLGALVKITSLMPELFDAIPTSELQDIIDARNIAAKNRLKQLRCNEKK